MKKIMFSLAFLGVIGILTPNSAMGARFLSKEWREERAAAKAAKNASKESSETKNPFIKLGDKFKSWNENRKQKAAKRAQAKYELKPISQTVGSVEDSKLLMQETKNMNVATTKLLATVQNITTQINKHSSDPIVYRNPKCSVLAGGIINTLTAIRVYLFNIIRVSQGLTNGVNAIGKAKNQGDAKTILSEKHLNIALDNLENEEISRKQVIENIDNLLDNNIQIENINSGLIASDLRTFNIKNTAEVNKLTEAIRKILKISETVNDPIVKDIRPHLTKVLSFTKSLPDCFEGIAQLYQKHDKKYLVEFENNIIEKQS